MDKTFNLELPYIMPSQAQKHVTHNEAIRALDAVIHIGVLDRDISSPPASPGEGDRYLVGADPTGAWSGSEGQLAAYQDGAWRLFAPREGWLVWVADEGLLVIRRSDAWQLLSDSSSSGGGGGGGGTPVERAPFFGINTDADATNRLAVKSDAVLLSHDDVTPGSGDMRFALNKRSTAQTASVIFQDAFSGRAEVGLTGNNALSIRLSVNGTDFAGILAAEYDRVTVDVPFRFQRYLAGHLPPAAAAGEGSMIMIVHADNRTPIPAFSDGNVWRAIHDNSQQS